MAKKSTVLRAGLALGTAFCLAGAPGEGLAQNFERLSPKTPVKEPKEPVETKAGPAATTGESNPAAPPLKGVLVVQARTEIQAKGDVAVAGLKLGPGSDLAILRHADFEKLVNAYVGKPLDELHLNKLQRDIVLYYRKSGHPLVDVVFPDQESVGAGVLQVFILEGKLGKVAVEGNKYFSTNDFVGEIRLKQGEAVNVQKLTEDIDWLNQNPARNVDAAFKPGDKLGESDLVLRVQDRFPLRGFVGYENSGARLAGEHRLLAGLNWFDAFGAGHRFSYQYTTDVDFNFIRAHSANYDIPLPWRHTLSFFGGYVDSEADLGGGVGPVSLKGASYQFSTRYQIPLPRVGNYSQDVSFGIDLKEYDNNFEFGGITLAATKVDVVQAVGTYRGSISDPFGRTSFGFDGYYSPGGITSNNKDVNYAALRGGSKAGYIYGKLNLQRETPLPGDFTWIIRCSGQLADKNLQSSEQFGIGGYSTVRGYREREANGDSGVFLSTEVYTPAWPLLGHLGSGFKDRFQLLGFLDYGKTAIKQVTLPNEARYVTLASAGAGVRYSVRSNLSIRFDWGWQLNASGDPNGRNDQGHLAVVLSY